MPVHVGVARIRDFDAPVGNGADVGRGAADIDRDQVRAAAEHALGTAADDAAGGARHQDAYRLLRTGFDRGDAAIRLNDPEVGAKAAGAELGLQVVEVERCLRPDKGVHRRGRKALIFADDIGDLGRGADIGVGHLGTNDLGGAPLVRIVEKREQKADDHGFDAAALEQPRRFDDLFLSERNFDRALGRQDTLGHRDTVAPLDQRPLLPGNLEMQREIVRAFVPADVEDVAEVARRQHADFGAVVLYGDVGGNGGPVNDQGNVVGTHLGDLAQLPQPFEHAFGLVMRRAGNLVHKHAVIGLEDEVGIGTADIDAYTRHDRLKLSPPGVERLSAL